MLNVTRPSVRRFQKARWLNLCLTCQSNRAFQALGPAASGTPFTLHVRAHRLRNCLLERAITNGRITTWLDVLRQYADIAQRPRPALHALTAVAAAMAATARPTPRRAAAGASYSSSGGGSGGRSSSSSRPRWSRARSSVSYTPAQVQLLTPIRQTGETRAAEQPYLRDVLLCHAWDDRQGPAKELHHLLVAAGVKVWFGEKDLGLGAPTMRAIDMGLEPV